MPLLILFFRFLSVSLSDIEHSLKSNRNLVSCSYDCVVYWCIVNLELTEKGFHYTGIKAWNDIPVNTRELPSLRLFKIHLKRHLTSLDN